MGVHIGAKRESTRFKYPLSDRNCNRHRQIHQCLSMSANNTNKVTVKKVRTNDGKKLMLEMSPQMQAEQKMSGVSRLRKCRQQQREMVLVNSSSLSTIRLNNRRLSKGGKEIAKECNSIVINDSRESKSNQSHEPWSWSSMLFLPGAESLSACIVSSQISALLSSTKKIDLIRTLSLVVLFLFISSNLPTSTDAIGFEQSKCETAGWNAFPVWKYRAKPRFVPPLRMDKKMQMEFFELFRGGGKYYHGGGDGSSSEEDSNEEVPEVPLNIPELHRIADMCPRDAFFYSLSPKHSEAAMALAQMLVALPSPPVVLKVARAILYSGVVNPKVWYYGIIAASQQRPDMTGFTLAHPLDAMPDLFIPGHLIYSIMDQYRSALRERGDVFTGNNTISLKKRKGSIRIKRASETKLSFTNTTSSSSSSSKTLRPSMKRKIKSLKKQQRDNTGSKKVSKVAQQSSKVDETTNEKNETGKASGGGSVPKKEADRESRGLKYSIRSGIRAEKEKKLSGIGKYHVDKKKKPHQRPLNYSSGKKQKIRPETRAENTSAEIDGATSDGILHRGRHDAFEDCVVVDGSIGLKNGIENKLWYFREDMMVNQHHWYWHQEYPTNTTMPRPRRAELFFYMHRNLVARYNAERLSNGMERARPFDIRYGAEIKSAYDSHIADINSGKFWTPRPPGIHLTDIVHMEDPDFVRNIPISFYNDLYGRIVRSIKVGHLLKNSVSTLKIRNTKGIEPLANTIEATTQAVNPMFYDALGFHNLGHQLIGLSTDPKWEERVPVGVMGDTGVTMRDPAFYSFHTLTDNIFDLYKKSLPPYQLKGGEYPLRWDGVEIVDIEVLSKTGGIPNQLRTFWSTRKFGLAPGVDQSIHKGDLDVDVCAVHLDHEPFDFKITISLDPCAVTKSNKGSVRIFLAPRFDEHGKRFSLKEQRRLMIHLDTFPADLRVGKNIIYRRSYDSNLLTPWTKTIDEYLKGPKYPHSAEWCGCGWPTHLYIPKGSPKGLPFDLFVMITNFDHDYVEEDPRAQSFPEPCNSPYMYCGLKFRNYPDAKPMGYPFDRLPYSVPFPCPGVTGPGVYPGSTLFWKDLLCKFMNFFFLKPVSTLEEYVSYAPNMAATVVEIKHLDKLAW